MKIESLKQPRKAETRRLYETFNHWNILFNLLLISEITVKRTIIIWILAHAVIYYV